VKKELAKPDDDDEMVWAPPKKPKGIPSLKIGGLGLSTLIQDDGKTQEEQDV
jgi:hypothetical protein